jgi:hypothetical protein
VLLVGGRLHLDAIEWIERLLLDSHLHAAGHVRPTSAVRAGELLLYAARRGLLRIMLPRTDLRRC